MLTGNYIPNLTGKTLERSSVYRLEQLTIASGLKYTIVQASFFMDNFTTGFYLGLTKKGVLKLANGRGRSSLIAASDVGAFFAEALAQGLTGSWVVTGPESLDTYEVAKLLSEKYGTEITYSPVDPERIAGQFQAAGYPPETIDYGITLYQVYRNDATAPVTDGFKQATGRDPITFRQFLGLN